MFAFIPMLAVIGGPQNSTVPPMLENVHRIVMLGDSITQMGGSPKGYVTLVDHALREEFPQSPIEVINAGISGQKAPDMLARFRRDVIDKHPDLVTISVGVNDVWHDFRTPEWTARVASGDSGRGVKLDVYERDVQAMITQATQAGAKVMLLSPSLVYEDLNCAENQRLTKYVDAERRLAERNKVLFIDLNRTFKLVIGEYQKFAGKSQLLLTIDGVHLNDAGNALYANEILKALGAAIPDHLSPGS